MKLIAGVLAAAALVSAAPAVAAIGGAESLKGSISNLPADPSECDLHDKRLCGDPSKIYYCPSTGGMVTWMQPCPALVLGPYGPGNPSPVRRHTVTGGSRVSHQPPSGSIGTASTGRTWK